MNEQPLDSPQVGVHWGGGASAFGVLKSNHVAWSSSEGPQESRLGRSSACLAPQRRLAEGDSYHSIDFFNLINILYP